MGDKSNFKKNFTNIFYQLPKICKDTVQEADNIFKKGRKDAFDDLLQWYNNISENGEKLVTINQIMMHIQEKLDKTKYELNKNNLEVNNIEDGSNMGRLFSFPSYN